MTFKEPNFWFECTFGDRSHLNLVVKIVFSPFILWVGLIFWVLERLFTKRSKENIVEGNLNAQDLQRRYNYLESARMELVMLAPRVPFIKKTNGIENIKNPQGT